MTFAPAGFIFDVYGTLLDAHGAAAVLESYFPAKGQSIAARWRVKQIDYTWVRTLCGRYVDFWVVTGDALDFACEFEGVTLTREIRSAVLSAYERLPPHPEVASALAKIAALGLPMGVLSNGDTAMLEKALSAAGLRGLFAHVLSVDRVGKFKTASEVYQLGPEAFGKPADEILFVSSNGWDACGAGWFGYRAFWINRTGAPRERLDAPIEAVGRSMDDLVAYLAGS